MFELVVVFFKLSTLFSRTPYDTGVDTTVQVNVDYGKIKFQQCLT